MQIPIYLLFVLLGIALVSSAGFVAVASSLSKKTVGRPLYLSTAIIWIVGTLLVQAVLAAWAFHPLTYIIIMGIVCIAEWVAIAVPSDRKAEEIEPPGTRFLAWFVFALGPFASMFVSALQRTDGWAFAGRAIPLYFLPLVAVLVVGLLRIALCGLVTTEESEELDDDEVDEDLDADDDEVDEDVDIIDGTEDLDEDDDDDEDEFDDELEELETEDCDVKENVA